MAYNILELIPQRPPIVMVDEFLSLEGNLSTTSLKVRDDIIFVDEGEMSECGLIEHIAQSAAARVGYVCRQENREVPVGFIGSVDKFSIERLPKVGEVITTGVEILQQVYSISLIQASCRIGTEQIAQCRMKIFLKDD